MSHTKGEDESYKGRRGVIQREKMSHTKGEDESYKGRR